MAPLLLSLFLGALLQSPAPPAGAGEVFRLGSIEIVTADVYSEDDAAGSPFFRFVNAIHGTTREEVVQREIWFTAGQEVSQSEIAELERNLRATGLFASVVVRAEAGEEPGMTKLVVDTRDRLSLVFGGSGALVGGVGSFSVLLGETNLFGNGDRVVLNYSETDQGEERAGLSFTDRHFFDPRLRLSGSVGETEEGPFYSLGVRRRFLHLGDDEAWGVSGSHSEDAVDFFASGDSVAEVPRRFDGVDAYTERAWGPRDARSALGLDIDYSETDYAAARGPAAATIDVPGDTDLLTIGPFWRLNEIWKRDKVTNLDTLDFVQDVELGWRPALFTGAVFRDEEGEGSRVEPLVRASVRAAFELGEGTYLSMDAGGSARLYAGSLPGWSASGSVHAYHVASPHHTLAASLTYDQVVERENLPVQLTLGEDNGLRGYPAREFSGTKRARLNLEDRIDTGLEIRSVHIDLVAFADAGWVDGEALSPDEILASVGLGLRIGSNELFGPGVMRIDVAFALNDVPSVEDDVSVSVAFGQVFTFFGNSSVLPGR